MKNFLCLMSGGALGCPKVEVGQVWVYDDEDNPFLNGKNKQTFTVTDIKGKYVRYNSNFWGHTFDRTDTINGFRWIRRPIE